MDAGNALQDSGLSDGRLLARLLQCGVVVLDEHAGVRFASADACELLGAPNEAALRDGWDGIGSQLCIADWPAKLREDATHQGRVVLNTASGTRELRFEVHAVSGRGAAQRLVLIRDCRRLLATDRGLLLAAEAQANRHVLTGLVHAAKGPLNNFNLTLALLASSVARANATFTPETLARWNRYIDVLRTETTRLADCLDDIHALALPYAPSRESIDVCALLRDVVRELRHDAMMREVDLDLDAPETPVQVVGDPQLVRLALLSFTSCVIDVTRAKGSVTWHVERARDAAGAPTIAITTAEDALPPDLVISLFKLTSTADSAHALAIAGRLIVETQGGDVSLDGSPAEPSGFVLRIPAHA